MTDKANGKPKCLEYSMVRQEQKGLLTYTGEEMKHKHFDIKGIDERQINTSRNFNS